MVHATNAAAAAAASTAASSYMRPRPGRDRSRTSSVGSFRAGSPLPTLRSTVTRTAAIKNSTRRLSAQHHYQTFPTVPPKTPGRRHSFDSRSPPPSSPGDSDQSHDATPLPYKQLGLLALLSLAEQSALNSISPYLPEMIASFPDVAQNEVGLYVGLLASSFALAQLATNLFWGYLADSVGRKPVILLGTSLLCICFAFFGFCSRYWHIILVHVAMGLLNGNATVVPTCLGELTDRSNQSRAFTWLPVVYSLGSITGPALGGILVGKFAEHRYPYLAPNIVGALLLALSVVVLAMWFEETLEKDERWGGSEWTQRMQWASHFMAKTKNRLKRFLFSKSSGGVDIDRAADDSADDEYGDEEETRLLSPSINGENGVDSKLPSEPATWRQLWNRTTIVLLITSLVFQLSNSSFNSLYPVFASGKPPTGRALPADVIGLSLSIAGIVTILFQLFLFRPLKSRVGNVGSYRGALLGFGLTMALIPFVGYKDSSPPFSVGDSKLWLYAEIGFILVIKNICAVGGLSSVMLLVSFSVSSTGSYQRANSTLADYEFCTLTRDPRHTEWDSPDAVRCWPECGAIPIRRPLYPVNTCAAQRRGLGVGLVCWHRSRWLAGNLCHPWRRSREH